MISPSNPFTVQITSISPDGTIALPGQSLITAQGTWSFGTAGDPGGNALLLNGTHISGYGVKLEVKGGNLYTVNAIGKEYKWGGSSWGASSDPL